MCGRKRRAWRNWRKSFETLCPSERFRLLQEKGGCDKACLALISEDERCRYIKDGEDIVESIADKDDN